MNLTDLLVSVTVLGMVMTTNVVLLDSSRRAWHAGTARVEAQENARIALARLATDLRTAGAGPTPTFAAVTVAETARIVFHRDENEDGVIAGPRETITWKLDGSILRRDAGGGAQPIVNGVAAFALEYFDAEGAPTSTPADVRSVQILVTTEASTSGRGEGAATVTTRVRLRNR